MRIQYILSVVLLAVFVFMVLIRAVTLRRHGVKAIVFGQTDKSDFVLVPIVLAIIYTALSNTFGLPMWRVLVQPFWRNPLPGWIGLALCLISCVGFFLTLIGFGDSFRVGIDERKPGKLVTGGMFAISRNPIYVCFLSFFIGLYLVHHNIVISVAVIIFALAIHRQVLREEVFLLHHYGAEYEEYCERVRRYF